MSITRPLSEQSKVETLEGYLVDIACLRKYPRDELAQRAREHTRDCVLMGHCVESGYALVRETGEVALLDPGATPLVLDVVRRASAKRGIRLRVRREMEKRHMKTTHVEPMPQK